MAPAIKNALDMARKENVKPPAVLEKADKEYKRLKQSADLLKTEDDKKFNEFKDFTKNITEKTFDRNMTNNFVNLYNLLKRIGNKIEENVWSSFSFLLKCHEYTERKTTKNTNVQKPKTHVSSLGHSGPRGIKQHQQRKQVSSPRDYPDSSDWIEMQNNYEEQLVNLKKELDYLKSETSDQKKQLEEKEKRIEELTTRLSRVASQQLTQGNPNITDLSDGNRPTKLGERFSQVYDDQWSEAFEALKAKGKEEKEIVKELLQIVQSIYGFMQKSVGELMQKLASETSKVIMCPFQSLQPASYREVPLNGTEGLFRDLVKTQGHHALKSVQEKLKVTIHVRGEDKRIDKYIEILSEIIWYMVIQDPPMVLKFIRKGETMDKEGSFKPYSKTGSVAEVCVWPALLLHERGPMIAKGFALPQ